MGRVIENNYFCLKPSKEAFDINRGKLIAC